MRDIKEFSADEIRQKFIAGEKFQVTLLYSPNNVLIGFDLTQAAADSAMAAHYFARNHNIKHVGPRIQCFNLVRHDTTSTNERYLQDLISKVNRGKY